MSFSNGSELGRIAVTTLDTSTFFLKIFSHVYGVTDVPFFQKRKILDLKLGNVFSFLVRVTLITY